MVQFMNSASHKGDGLIIVTIISLVVTLIIVCIFLL